MAPGGNFFARVFQYLLNDAIVKGLSSNPAFQRFAVRTNQQMQQVAKQAAETAKAIKDSPAVAEAQKEATKATRDMGGRVSAFMSELRQELFRGRR